jgi:cyd operon protein YbgT
MWYFSWILGLGLAAAFAILNALWFELDADRRATKAPADEKNVT